MPGSFRPPSLIRVKWFWSVNFFRWALAQSFKLGYKYISIILINYSAADWEFLDLYLKSVHENSADKEPCFERKIKDEIKLYSEHLL